MSDVPRRLFLTDAVGALLTAALLAGVVARWARVFGMPTRVLYPLAAVACVMAAYSLVCSVALRGDWRPWLLAIAIANIVYGAVTLAFVAVHYGELTRVGVSYFVLEGAVLAGVVWVELRAVAGRSAGLV